MKKIILSFSLLAILFSACKKENPDADVSIVFTNQIDGQAIQKDKLIYTNAKGNKYSVGLLKYFVTNVSLVNESGTEYKLNNYDLIDEFSKENFSTVEASAVPNGRYTKLKFFLGLDKTRNHEGAQDGDLDPIHNMIWTWATGYIFMKHEGQYITPTGDTTVMQFHLATDNALRTVEIPMDFTVNGENKNLNILFNLNNMYNSPMIDIHVKPIMHSSTSSDADAIQNLANNASDAFSFIAE